MDENDKITYYEDSARKYLVIQCPNIENDENGYQYRMITSNPIDGLLKSSLRHIDGETFLYYEITGMESLQQLVNGRNLDERIVKSLLMEMACCGKTLTGFLLDENKLIPDPSCIFYNYDSDEFFFIYFPGEEMKNGWENLFDFLITATSPQDKATQRALLRLGDIAERPHYVIKEEDVQKIFGEGGKEKRQEPLFHEYSHQDRIKTSSEIPEYRENNKEEHFTQNEQKLFRRENNFSYDEKVEDSEQDDIYEETPEQDTDDYLSDSDEDDGFPIKRKNRGFAGEQISSKKEVGVFVPMIGSVASLFAVIALLVVRESIEVTVQTETILRGAIAALLFLSIALAIWGTVISLRKKNTSEMPENENKKVGIGRGQTTGFGTL